MRVGKRGPYKTMNGKPVMTPEQRKKAKAERDKLRKQMQKTDAAKRCVHQKKEFAKQYLSAPKNGKKGKQTVSQRLSAAQNEKRLLREENKELKKKEAARANKPNIKLNAARAALFNEAWRMLDYLSRHSSRLRSFRDES